MADLATETLLAIVTWLHLLAVVGWIGGTVTNTLVTVPAAQEALPPPSMGKLLGAIMKRLRVVVYLSIVAFVSTGAVKWYFSHDFIGFFNISTTWAIILLVKHVFVGIMVLGALYSFEVMAPKVAAEAAKGPSPELARLQKNQMNAANLGFVLGLVILAFTAILEAL